MDVKGIRNTSISPNVDYVKKNDAQKPAGAEPKSDKIELSDFAKKVQGGEVSSKDLSVIRKRITDNFYNKDSVIDTVAQNILKEISQ